MVCGIVLLATSFAIHRQDAGAALTETGTVILEIKHDGMLARRERRWGFPSEAFQVKKIVHEDWFALEQVETMATAAAPERIDHTFCTCLRNFDLCSDGVGLAGNVGGAAVGKTGRLT